VALAFHPLVVVAVVDETADSRSFVLEVPPELRERFAYRAGQFLTFEIPWTGFSIRRCYSLSSCPEVDPAPRITVKRVAGGRASNWLIDRVKAGDVLQVSPPDGRFVLDPAAGARLLTLYGAGSGITPLLSILESALVTTGRSVHLIYANRDPAAIIGQRELDQLARQYRARFTLQYHCDANGGFLTVADIESFLRGREAGDHYVCGPAPFMDLVARALESADIAAERRYFERFVSPLDPDRRAALLRAPSERPAHPSSFTLTLAGITHSIAYEPGLTLLAAARRAGIDAPFSCADGYCGSCAAASRVRPMSRVSPCSPPRVAPVSTRPFPAPTAIAVAARRG
jgi:3-ketosteroid 9alpha-monooxygenase subunit B